MLPPFRIADSTYVLPLTLPIPTRGLLYLNCLVLTTPEPVIVDTGPAVLRHEFLDAAFSVVDPSDVRWIFLSHDDRDHAGNVMELLDLCPMARLVTNFQGVTRLQKEYDVPLRRVLLVESGEAFPVGDRGLVPLRPPLFDSPATRGLFDTKTGTYFSVDCFAAVLPEYFDDAAAVPADLFEEGFNWLNRANAPWYGLTDPDRMRTAIDQVRRLCPPIIVSYHGPVAYGMSDRLCRMLATMPRDEEVTFPDLDALISQLQLR